jgi:hypothetical protein
MTNNKSACYITHKSKRTIGQVQILLQGTQYPYNLGCLT